jgi:class 3 adenylate cyclase
MFTDIAGYSAIMDKDERMAIELLEKNRSIQKPLINRYHGKWLKEMGD